MIETINHLLFLLTNISDERYDIIYDIYLYLNNTVIGAIELMFSFWE